MNIQNAINDIIEHGYAVIPDAIPDTLVEAIKSALEPWLQKQHMGRNDFEGFKSERVYALLEKAPVIANIVEHADVLAIVDHFLEPNYLLSSNLAINVHPGETPQSFHADHTNVPNVDRRALNGLSAIWAFDDFDATNGATEVIPGSHMWPDLSVVDNTAPTKITMRSGSVVVFHGALIHRGGANNANAARLAITPQYCQPWLRPLENMSLAVSHAIAPQYSPRLQGLLDYSVRDPGFQGHVNGLHPKRLLTNDYQGRRARGTSS